MTGGQRHCKFVGVNTVVVVVLCVLVACIAFGLGAVFALRADARRRARSAEDTILSKADVLHSALLQAPIAVIVVDKFEDIILSNDRAEELGVVIDGRRLVPDVWDAAVETFTSGDDTRFNIPARTKGAGRTVPSVAGRAQFLHGDNQQFVIVFADDDSEQRRMESARRDFVANVSHELKTPVGAMAVLAEALLESKDDPESVTYFGERVVGEAHRLGSMVTELIELSRLQGAEKVRDPQLVSVDDIVNEAVQRSASVAEAHSITLTTDSPSGLELMGDRTLLITAISNLISNAINYSPAGTPVVVTRMLEGESVLIRVTDHGIGIAPEHQSRVFERFFRVDKARSRATGGTGLGLAIVKHVINNHNGQVKLWSRPGMGSTFTLQLPAHMEPSARIRTRSHPAKAATAPPTAHGAAAGAPQHDESRLAFADRTGSRSTDATREDRYQ